MSVTSANEHGPALGLARLLHPVTSKKKILAALAASTDGSGIHDTSRICAVAGYVGTEEEWDLFESRWTGAIKEAGITAFRMPDFENRRGEFAGWSDTKRRLFLEKLIQIINAGHISGVGSALVMAEYKLLSKAEKIALTYGRPHDPYVLCFRHCIVEAAHRADGLPPEETVSFVFDWQDEFGPAALWLFDDLKNLESPPIRQRLGAIGFESKLEFVPLQAADLLAFECYKHLEDRYYGRHRGVRWPMKRLQSRPFRPRYFDRDAIRTMQSA